MHNIKNSDIEDSDIGKSNVEKFNTEKSNTEIITTGITTGIDFYSKKIYQYSDMVYRLAYSLVKNRYDADDIYQEVFLRYIRKCPKFQSLEHEKAWFLKVTINCCKNFWTSGWKKHFAEWKEREEDFIKQGELSRISEIDTDKQEIITIVKTLPEKYRVVIHLFYYEEMSVIEISKLLKRRPSTIRTQLTRARAILKEKLKEE